MSCDMIIVFSKPFGFVRNLLGIHAPDVRVANVYEVNIFLGFLHRVLFACVLFGLVYVSPKCLHYVFLFVS